MRCFWGLCVLAVLAASAAVRAQADTLACGGVHRFTPWRTAAPAALMAGGAAVASVPTLHEGIDVGLRGWAQGDGHGKATVDDWMQYAPLAAVPALKVCGLQSRHGWKEMCALATGSALLGTAAATGLKYGLKRERPQGGQYNSFPSGHTMTAFVGAELLRREYGEVYPWVAVGGYVVAAGVGAMRIYNDRHWASDVLAGAGLGILSVCVMYWVGPYLRF